MGKLTYNEIKNDLKTLTIIVNGREYQGKFSDVRFDTTTLPSNLHAFDLRHDDFDWGEPVSVKNGSVMVNYYGTFLCENVISVIPDIGEEYDLDDYDFDDDDDDDVIDLTGLNNALRKFILENGETVETFEGETTEKSIHTDPVFVKGVGFEINEIIADSDPDWDEVILSDCREADLSLAHLDDEEIKQLIDSIYGFEYEC